MSKQEDKFKKTREAPRDVSPLVREVLGGEEEKDKGGRPRVFDEDLKKLQVLLPESLKEAFKEAVRVQRTNISDVVREMITEYVEKYGPK